MSRGAHIEGVVLTPYFPPYKPPPAAGPEMDPGSPEQPFPSVHTASPQSPRMVRPYKHKLRQKAPEQTSTRQAPRQGWERHPGMLLFPGRALSCPRNPQHGLHFPDHLHTLLKQMQPWQAWIILPRNAPPSSAGVASQSSEPTVLLGEIWAFLRPFHGKNDSCPLQKKYT